MRKLQLRSLYERTAFRSDYTLNDLSISFGMNMNLHLQHIQSRTFL